MQHERRLLSERRQVATARRVQDPNLIFRDLRAPAARPVDSLLEHRSAEVGEVVVDEGALELTEHVDWRPDFPLLHKGQPLHVAHVDSDKIWVDLPEDCAPGDRIDQPVLLGSLPDVFSGMLASFVVFVWQRGLPPCTLSVSSASGRNTLSSLRAGAMEGIGAKAPGANARLHLGLVEHPSVDPGFYALASSFRDARVLSSQREFEPLLDQ